MAGACVKVSSPTLLDVDLNCHDDQVYTLEKVLKLKKDPISQIVFLDEAMKVGPTLPPHP
jgi:conserved oligomeric Golgi complex subunit COG5-like protein